MLRLIGSGSEVSPQNYLLKQKDELRRNIHGDSSRSDQCLTAGRKSFRVRLAFSYTIKQALQHKSGQMAQALNLALQLERSCALGQGLEPHCQPYLPLYQDELAQVQQRLAQAGC